MPNPYLAAQKLRYRITLEVEVMEDFDPHQINWEKTLDLQGEKLYLLMLKICQLQIVGEPYIIP